MKLLRLQLRSSLLQQNSSGSSSGALFYRNVAPAPSSDSGSKALDPMMPIIQTRGGQPLACERLCLALEQILENMILPAFKMRKFMSYKSQYYLKKLGVHIVIFVFLTIHYLFHICFALNTQTETLCRIQTSLKRRNWILALSVSLLRH